MTSGVDVSGGTDSEAEGGMVGGSSVGVGVDSGSRPASSSRGQSEFVCCPNVNVPSAFRRSARPFRLFAASERSCSRSFSRCSFSRWLLAAAPRGFCFGAEALVLSSSDSITGELLGDRELVRCLLTSSLVLSKACQCEASARWGKRANLLFAVVAAAFLAIAILRWRSAVVFAFLQHFLQHFVFIIRCAAVHC